MSDDFTMPTRKEVQDAIERGQQLRSEFAGQMIRNGFNALRTLPTRIGALLHRPAHS